MLSLKHRLEVSYQLQTFNGVGLDSAETAYANSAAASISMLFIVVAVIFGVIQKHVGKMNEWVKAVVAIALLVAMFAVGMKLPIYASKTAWIYIIMAYLFLAPMIIPSSINVVM